MVAPEIDLPAELWLKILGYLPKGTARKMIGVNRFLFELALDDLYQEIKLIHDDETTLKTFKQLHHTNIANRVHSCLIYPEFLPPHDDETQYLTSTHQKKVPKFLRRVSNNQNGQTLLETAKHALRLCPNIEEVTIILDHYRVMTSSCKTFLSSLWSPTSIGRNLRKLAIDTAPSHSEMVERSLVKHSRALSKLQELELTLTIEAHDDHDAPSAMLHFSLVISAFKSTLTSVTITARARMQYDSRSFLRFLPFIPNLRKFSLECHYDVASRADPDQPDALGTFLDKHSSTLEHLTIESSSYEHEYAFEDLLTRWLSEPDQQPNDSTCLKDRGFSQMVLPKLHTLEIGLSVSWSNNYSESPSGFINNKPSRKLVSNLKEIAPNLISLVLLPHVALAPIRVSQLANSLTKPLNDGNAGVAFNLEKLSLFSRNLYPELFDMFSASLPRLKSLHLRTRGTAGRRREEGIQIKKDFRSDMEKRHYPHWELRYLRIVDGPNAWCPVVHPDITAMKVVKRCLSNNLTLDFAFHCPCEMVAVGLESTKYP
ncbi:hypothetical protein B0H34DRAFT_724374 [Crassisporium funariophilum]|nr:hypothetical protein B0H34DRAFT_724374 [Crassisporium funariophilum]